MTLSTNECLQQPQRVDNLNSSLCYFLVPHKFYFNIYIASLSRTTNIPIRFIYPTAQSMNIST